MANESERDSRGWRIPRDGTTSRKVYDLLNQGFKSSESIAKKLKIKRATAAVLSWKIRNPEDANRYGNRWSASYQPRYMQRRRRAA